jgi:hypothetical protein
MKTPIELWVRLKVIDLVTQTAWFTFTEKLDFAGRLGGIVHYWYWGMDAEGADAKGILGEVDRVIRLDSAFTNQNKHLYRLSAAAGTAPALGNLPLESDFPMRGDATPAGGELFAIDCLVREKRPDRETGFTERLNGRLRGVAVSKLKYGEVWRLIARASSGESALADVEKMLVSRSRREGLLLNPHYQQYEILSTTRLGGGAIAAGAPRRAKE